MKINESYNAMMQNDEFREFVKNNKYKGIGEIKKEYMISENDVIKYIELFMTNHD